MPGLEEFLKVFIPLFVAMDPLGLVPIYVSITEGMTEKERRRTAAEAVLAASVISIGFMVAGDALFKFLGIETYDFKIGGGIILLVLAIRDLLFPEKSQAALADRKDIGIVPLAMPLIVGPATMTTTLVLGARDGYLLTMLGLLANFVVITLCLLGSSRIARVVGGNALRGITKLVMVLLGAIAVFFIRSGVLEMLGK